MSDSDLRCFIAIPVSPDVARLCMELAQATGCGRCLPEENLHLTLAFLGDQPKDRLFELEYALGSLQHLEFSVGFSGIGQFGDSLHLAVASNPALSSLNEKIVRCARQNGIELPRRRFRPHITIARGQRSTLFKGVFKVSVQHTRMIVTQFNLIASTLHPQGARYETLAAYPLQHAD